MGGVYQYDNQPERIPAKETLNKFLSPEEALIILLYRIGFATTAWGKLYKRELVEAHPYPVGKLYEDVATTYKIIGSSNGVAFGNKQIYYWIQRHGSITRNGFDNRQFDGLEASKNQLEYTKKNYPSALSAAKYNYTAKAVELTGIYFVYGGDKKLFKKLRDEMNRYFIEVLKDPKAKITIKFRMLAMKLGYYPAKIAFALHKKVKENKFCKMNK